MTAERNLALSNESLASQLGATLDVFRNRVKLNLRSGLRNKKDWELKSLSGMRIGFALRELTARCNSGPA